MQRASKSIGALAAAFAKAQIQLINPEKSLVATIREEGRLVDEQTFRYAPLSSGLEIVRKVLGQHEIATCRTRSMNRRLRQSHYCIGALIGRYRSGNGNEGSAAM